MSEATRVPWLRKRLIQCFVYALGLFCLLYTASYVMLRKTDRLVVDGSWKPVRLVWNSTPDEPRTIAEWSNGFWVTHYLLGWKVEQRLALLTGDHLADHDPQVNYVGEFTAREAKELGERYATVASLAKDFRGEYDCRYYDNYVYNTIFAKLDSEDWNNWVEGVKLTRPASMEKLSINEGYLRWKDRTSGAHILVEYDAPKLTIIYFESPRGTIF